MKTLDLSVESQYWRQTDTVIGIDEVGRGSFAGPLTAVAISFPNSARPLSGVNDSKQLTPASRAQLVPNLINSASVWAIAFISVATINQQGISTALNQAFTQLLSHFPSHSIALIDGIIAPYHPTITVKTIPHGDSLCYSIAGASIIAKHLRDQHLNLLHRHFPHYDWLHNKGYGTPTHRQAILTYGPTHFHRHLWLRRLLASTT